MSRQKLVVITLLAIVGISIFSVIIVRKLIFKDSWDVWVEKQVDFSIKQKLATAKRSNIVIPNEDITEIREKMQTELKADAAGLKEILGEPPLVMGKVFQFEYEQNMPKKYEGPWPQTAQSIMEAFDGLENHQHDYDDELDAKYPRAKWIAMLLEKGATFEHYGDYSKYMNARRGLMGRENNPEAWQSGNFGIAPASDWESFKNNYIDRQIWEVQQYNEARRVVPNLSGGTFMGHNDSVFLPFDGNTIYIDQSDSGFMSLGVQLTVREARDLMFKGIHPEGLEVIFIDDESGTFLNEKPSPLRWETIIDKAGPPPPGWEKNLPKGWEPPAKLVEAINDKFSVNTPKIPADAVEKANQGDIIPDMVPDELPEDNTLDRLKPTQAEMEKIRQAEEKIRQAEEKFHEMLTKNDAELQAAFETELAKFLTQEGIVVPSEVDFEKEFRRQFEVEVLTPQRFDKAMATLERYGMVEGFRKMQKDDPEVAKMIGELFGMHSSQRKSQRYTPPKPPETVKD